jgi:two-component system C4-dicarboxylate transport sensor histidine kinase DctB
VRNTRHRKVSVLPNALYALQEAAKKEIHIELRCKGDYVLISIRDTGSGIASEHMENIFDPFFTTKPPGKGTGLGLFICKNIINTHCGAINCSSHPARALTFCCLLKFNR